MYGITRAVFTLIGVAAAVVLIWAAAQIGDDTTADYWALYGLVAAAGLTMALSQLLGGWTKWGWPRLSGMVFLLGFIPALVVAGWVLAAGQPSDNWLQGHVTSWSDDLGLDGVVGDLLDLAGPLAFLAGLTFGFTFDTAGPRTAAVVEPERVEERRVEPGGEPEPVPAGAGVREGDAPTEARDEPRTVTAEPEAERETRPVEPTSR
jgi:hypothetical protein